MNESTDEVRRRRFERRYRETLRLPGRRVAPLLASTDSEATALAAALDRAYGLRDFEIEHYWKRGTYFWGFQLAIFAAYGLLWKDGRLVGSSFDLALALGCLGILTAFANVLSIQGSKFWYTNWERHIDMLEEQVEGRLHRIVWLDHGKPSFSVTRVNKVLGWCFLLFWVAATCKTAWIYPGFVPGRARDLVAGMLGRLGDLHVNQARLTVGIAVATVLVLARVMSRQRTELAGTMHTAGGRSVSVEFPRKRGARPPAQYVLRHGPFRE